jgi:hypothetical protein
MFASEFVESCGLASWSLNSHVVRATARALNDPFVRAIATETGDPVVVPRFAHEPKVIRGDRGEYVLFWTGCDPLETDRGSLHACYPAFKSQPATAANCSVPGDGSTPPAWSIPGSSSYRGPGHNIRANVGDRTWMSWATTPLGPWSKPVVVMNATNRQGSRQVRNGLLFFSNSLEYYL